jgi:hypothetical protein
MVKLRFVGALTAAGVALGAGWFARQAPSPDAHLRPLADGGRVIGTDGTPLWVDANADGRQDVVFWRSSANSLVAMNPIGGEYLWESTPFTGGFGQARAWVVPGRLIVAESNGVVTGLDVASGRQRFRFQLESAARELCLRSGEVQLSTADERTHALAPRSGERLGSRSHVPAALRLTECLPISGDRFPDHGEAKAFLWSDRPSASDAQALALFREPDGLSPSAYCYVPQSKSWVMYGQSTPAAGGSGPGHPLVAHVGTRGTALPATWLQPATGGDAQTTVVRERLVAVGGNHVFVGFSLPGERAAGVTCFDLASGQRRWELRIAPDALVAISASERHVAITWAGGTLRDTGGRAAYGLMVLDAETGARTAQIGSASLSR